MIYFVSISVRRTDIREGHQHMCKINVIISQTVMTLILQIGGSVRISLWILSQQRGYTGISVYLRYSTN
jgi:hypothetical protein